MIPVNADVYSSALRGEAECVVKQIANHRCKHHRFAPNRERFDQFETKIDAAINGLRQQIRDDILRCAIQLHR